MHVVATAGHVDHGKSTLVRALTGIDPDRLEEERRRGLTIELGYAWTTLAELADRETGVERGGSGAPGSGSTPVSDPTPVSEVAFVDVPGHERFVATMLAGVGPVPVAMLVVAADDPWMPQAAEHLAALDALGVRHGLVVVTRADLADPAAAGARAREEVDRTSLAGAPLVAVSARTGEGMDALRRTLIDVLAGVPAPDPADGVRLWVDRRFHVRGAGTVVTGTLASGRIEPGDRLALPDGSMVRVRGIEALGRPRERVAAPARVALDLGGHAPEAVTRGVPLVSPEAYWTTTVVDVAVSGQARLPKRPLLHIGSARHAVHARPLAAGLARLTLPEPLPLRYADRALLRDPGSRALWGVRVLDPAPPPLSRRGAAAARAGDLLRLDGSLAADLAVRGPAETDLLRRLGLSGPPPDDSVESDGWLVPGVTARRARLVELVAESGELAPAEAARRLGVPESVVASALVAPPLEHAAGRIRRAGAALPAPLAAALDRLRTLLADRPFAAPTADELTELGLDAAGAARLHRDGLVLRLAPGVVLLPEAADRAAVVLGRLPQPFTTSAARQALETSRRVVLPLLGHLDATGRTVRLADDTRRVRG